MHRFDLSGFAGFVLFLHDQLQGFGPGSGHAAKIFRPAVKPARFQVGVGRRPETEIDDRTGAALYPNSQRWGSTSWE
ncbi:MAG: hypothetical protein L6428_08465 [Candidatus Aminicenantes bacterium]|nr:hypothetical protein [Candidatus Aminicenantes bacterium]